MEPQQVNTDHRRISPAGMIDLPYVARLALGFHKGESKILKMQLTQGKIVISPSSSDNKEVIKASPRGLLRLSTSAHQMLSGGGKGRYSLEINKEKGQVSLQPTSKS